MPVEKLPRASWQTALGLGFVSAVFDNIPLTALALKQGGYDWGYLAYAVGFGGSMIWFGSSAGVALSNMYPEAKSVGLWLRHGWHVAVAYVVGFFVMLPCSAGIPTRADRRRGGRSGPGSRMLILSGKSPKRLILRAAACLIIHTGHAVSGGGSCPAIVCPRSPPRPRFRSRSPAGGRRRPLPRALQQLPVRLDRSARAVRHHRRHLCREPGAGVLRAGVPCRGSGRTRSPTAIRTSASCSVAIPTGCSTAAAMRAASTARMPAIPTRKATLMSDAPGRLLRPLRDLPHGALEAEGRQDFGRRVQPASLVSENPPRRKEVNVSLSRRPAAQ